MAVIVIYVDGSMFESLYDVNYEVQSDGLLATSISPSPKPSSKKFTYSGVNTLLGYSTSSSAVSPDTNFSVGDTGTISSSVTLYSVQQEPVDITISYKGSSIATMSASGTKTLETEGKYCEDDITVTYTKPAAPVPSLQTKSATYTPSTSQQTASITADAGYDGLDEVNVTVNAMPSGSATTPATTITANPTISVSSGGLITASVSASQSVTPTVSAGYVSSGTAGTVSVSGSNTSQIAVYNGAHHQPTPSTYTVTISLTNPYHAGDFVSCTILQTDAVYSTTGVQIGSISSPTGSADVTFDPTSQYTYLCVWFVGGYVDFNSLPTCSSGISYQDSSTGSDGMMWFLVNASGTITIPMVDYDG